MKFYTYNTGADWVSYVKGIEVIDHLSVSFYTQPKSGDYVGNVYIKFDPPIEKSVVDGILKKYNFGNIVAEGSKESVLQKLNEAILDVCARNGLAKLGSKITIDTTQCSENLAKYYIGKEGGKVELKDAAQEIHSSPKPGRS